MQIVRGDDSDYEEDESLKGDDTEVAPDSRVVEIVREGEVTISRDDERSRSRTGEGARLVLGGDIRVVGTGRNDLRGGTSEVEVVELVREHRLRRKTMSAFCRGPRTSSKRLTS